MSPTSRLPAAVAAGLFALALGVAPAVAQDYPARPITVIVPFAAGGPTDVIARIVGDHMSKTLGQTLVIENVVGAGGTTGITRGVLCIESSASRAVTSVTAKYSAL